VRRGFVEHQREVGETPERPPVANLLHHNR
jgi:hypothetical protein